MAKHASITRGQSEKLMLTSFPGARTVLNGIVLVENIAVKLKHEDRIIFGNSSVFKCVVPGGADIGVEVNWEFAMKEANSEMLKIMSTFNDGAVAAGRKEKEEMESKVQELERMLTDERNRAAKDNKGKEELEEKLAKQIEETGKLLKRQERERQENYKARWWVNKWKRCHAGHYFCLFDKYF